MTILLSAESLAARRAVVTPDGPLAPLAATLSAELEPLRGVPVYFPREKALLSREGGRCPRHGVYLEFDPFNPNEHRCPVCGEVFRGELHDRFWPYWYQLWLAERAVHAAAFAALGVCDEDAGLARDILAGYADRYLEYPNVDNVLGPTRLFFSTYLESIWLLQICIATSLLEGSGRDAGVAARVRDRIVEPSRALIASYDEGASNRQVWNNAALLASAVLLGRSVAAADAVFGRSGVVRHLEGGLLADGTWYEGENYHLFAHRGLWYGVTLAERAGLEIRTPLLARFGEGFVTPFLTALPDFTLPSRRDSQYAISLRQPRFAESCELGLGRDPGPGDPRLLAALARLYEADVAPGETGRARSTADVERNLPATSLTRADLGWRSLFFARPVLPPLEQSAPRTVLLPEQGIALFRRARGRVAAALDYGASGGGHGHPDRLNVLLSDGATRWLDDMGTGSYVDPSLHWYRSTLAHNAPLFNGAEQLRVDGELLAFEERAADEMGWVLARARGLAPGVVATRAVVAMRDYMIDQLMWWAEAPVVTDLPIHVDATPSHDGADAFDAAYATPLQLDQSLQDTLGVLRDESARWLPARRAAELTAKSGGRSLRGWLLPAAPSLLYRAVGPGAPGKGDRPFLVLRSATAEGRSWTTAIWAWGDAVRRAYLTSEPLEIVVELADGTRHVHHRTYWGWRTDVVSGESHRAIELAGWRPTTAKATTGAQPLDAAPVLRLSAAAPLVFHLGGESYRRSEESWDEADRPTATVTLRRDDGSLEIVVEVRKRGPLTFVPAGAINPYDNESADINGDGVQLYVTGPQRSDGWLLVPEGDGIEQNQVRIREIADWGAGSPHPRRLDASWQRNLDGYMLRAVLRLLPGDRSPDGVGIGVVVNEKPNGRERRRGQLVLGGAHGGFVYLRGDREDAASLPRFLLPS